jgi:hypothetical protein
VVVSSWWNLSPFFANEEPVHHDIADFPAKAVTAALVRRISLLL